MSKVYENLDSISTSAQYREAVRQLAADMVSGVIPHKKASGVMTILKEIRGSLMTDVAILSAAGQQVNPDGEIASWSVPSNASILKGGKVQGRLPAQNHKRIVTGGEISPPFFYFIFFKKKYFFC